MKLPGWIFLALLIGIQLLAWGVYGKEDPEPALHLLVFLVPILCGSFQMWFFYQRRAWAVLPPVVLMITHLGFAHAPKHAPRSALLDHYLIDTYDPKVGSWESFVISGVVLVLMFLLAAVTAFLTVEMHGWMTRRGVGCGWRFFVAMDRALTRREKQNLKTPADET